MTVWTLVCTNCGAVIIKPMEIVNDMKNLMGAGCCNRCPEQAQLEWKEA